MDQLITGEWDSVFEVELDDNNQMQYYFGIFMDATKKHRRMK